MKMVCVKMPEEMVEQIDEYLDKHPEFSGRSEVVRAAIREYLMKHAKQPQQDTSFYEETVVVIA